MYRLVVVWFVLYSTIASAQSESSMLKKTAYHALINTLVSNSIETIAPSKVVDGDYLFLDTRERKEFEVSSIKNAKYVGYDSFDIASMKGIDKNTKIIVYCSVGYRSEKIGEKLKAAGFNNVMNLYGGIFEWVNSGNSVVDSLGNETNQVHGYSRTWGIWVDSSTVVYD